MSPEPPHAETDAFCRGCGYLLRGLPDDGACPECGHSILDSLRAPPDLTQLPARCLGRVRAGLYLALAGWLGLGIAYLLPMAGFWLGLASPLSGLPVGGWEYAPLCTVFASLLVLTVSVWVCTPADAALRPFGRLDEFRFLTRLSHGATLGLLVYASIAQSLAMLFLGLLTLAAFFYFAMAWASELAVREPLNGHPLGPAYRWLPVIALLLIPLAVITGSDVIRVAAMLAALGAWATTAYAIHRALRAACQARRLLRERAQALDSP
ncbi:MAG: hypothetical protein AMXMBFR47_35440 [Planctomycetota bacterium]